ncbi:hypothetical protein HNY73_000131 [Argiope bruennichi]|uniref:Uncharacterized protein n=1 Tax=Argiope bruennichi TaxID=94029 RepID=A0A8T0FZG8_ARGBR|nr:hypothetical protein HNY73_000131 [Argiope bruennichi]
MMTATRVVHGYRFLSLEVSRLVEHQCIIHDSLTCVKVLQFRRMASPKQQKIVGPTMASIAPRKRARLGRDRLRSRPDIGMSLGGSPRDGRPDLF